MNSSKSASKGRFKINELLEEEVPSRVIKTAQNKLTVYSNTLHSFRPVTQGSARIIKRLEQKTSPSADAVQRVRHRSASKREIRSRLDLKEVLGRIQLMSSRQEEFEQQDVLQTVVEAIVLLSETDNCYQNQFGFIRRVASKFIFFDRTFADLSLVNKIRPNQKLLKYSSELCVQRSSWRNLFNQLLSEYNSLVQQAETIKQDFNNKVAGYEEQLAGKRDRIQTMKKQLQYYNLNPNQSLAPIIQMQDKQLKEKDKQIARLNKSLREKKDEIEMMRVSNNRLNERIQLLKGKIYDLQALQRARNKDAEKNPERKTFEKEVTDLKEMLDKSIIRLVAMKDEYEKVKKLNFQLITERSELTKRAAVSFSQLTPRPRFKELFQEEGLNFDTVTKGTKKKLNTEAFFKMLLGRFKQVHQQLTLCSRERKIVLDARGEPLNKMVKTETVEAVLEEVADNTVAELDRQKEQQLLKIEHEPKQILDEMVRSKQKIGELQVLKARLDEKDRQNYLRLVEKNKELQGIEL